MPEVTPSPAFAPDSITFSTGRSFYVYSRTIGLDPNLYVYYGSDGDLPTWYYGDDDWRKPEQIMTEAERLELADYMIEAWQRFKAATGPEKQT